MCLPLTKSESIAIPQVRLIPILLQRPKLTTPTSAGGRVATHMLHKMLTSNFDSTKHSNFFRCVINVIASFSVDSSGGQPQTNPANFAQLQHNLRLWFFLEVIKWFPSSW